MASEVLPRGDISRIRGYHEKRRARLGVRDAFGTVSGDLRRSAPRAITQSRLNSCILSAMLFIVALWILATPLFALQTRPRFRWEPRQILQPSHGPAPEFSPGKQASYSPDGNHLAILYPVFENDSPTGHIIEFWNTRSWQIESTITEQATNGDLILVWSPVSTQVVVVSGWPGTAIRIWDVRSRTVVRSLEGHGFRVNSIAWSPDAALIASTTEGTIDLWDANKGVHLKSIGSGAWECHALAWSQDSKRIAAACADIGFSRTRRLHDEFRIWDVASGRLVKSLSMPINSGYGLHAIAWSPDLTQVISLNASGSSTLVYDLRVRRVKRVPLKSLAWSPDSRYIVVADQHMISIWNAEDGTIVQLANGTFACWSPDSRNIALTGKDGFVHIWTRIDIAN